MYWRLRSFLGLCPLWDVPRMFSNQTLLFLIVCFRWSNVYSVVSVLAASLYFFAIVDVRLLALVFHCTHNCNPPNHLSKQCLHIGFQPEVRDPQLGCELISRRRCMITETIMCLKMRFYWVYWALAGQRKKKYFFHFGNLDSKWLRTTRLQHKISSIKLIDSQNEINVACIKFQQLT